MRDIDRDERQRLREGLDAVAELIMMVFVSGRAKDDLFWADWAGCLLSGYEVGYSEVACYVPECARLYRQARDGLKITDCDSAIRVALIEAATHLLTVETSAALDSEIHRHLSEGQRLQEFARELMLGGRGA